MHEKNFEPLRSASSGTAIEIRDARVADAEAIEEVHYSAREAVYEGHVAEWPPPGPDRQGRIELWTKWLSDPDVSCVVGEVGAEIVGFCTIRTSRDRFEGDRVAEMPTLYVRPGAWHQGYGQALCGAALKKAKARGFDVLTLWVLEMNHRAREFYKEFGFAPDGGTKVDEGTRERLIAFRYRIDLRGRK